MAGQTTNNSALGEINKVLMLLTCALLVSLQAMVVWQLQEIVAGQKRLESATRDNATNNAGLTATLAASNARHDAEISRLIQSDRDTDKRLRQVEGDTKSLSHKVNKLELESARRD